MPDKKRSPNYIKRVATTLRIAFNREQSKDLGNELSQSAIEENLLGVCVCVCVCVVVLL